MEITICWFRRDLRIEDNSALYHALKSGYPVLPVFVFDTEIISGLAKDDQRLIFIYQAVKKLKQALESVGSSILVQNGIPGELFLELFKQYRIHAIFAGIDYEPYSISRDQRVRELCMEKGAGFHGFHDHVIFRPDEVLKSDGSPYHVFTPYMRRWTEAYEGNPGRNFPS